MRIFNTIIISAALVASATVAANAKRIAYFPMEVTNGKIYDTEANRSFSVETANIAESGTGVKGNALRLDGYSNFVSAQINGGELPAMTFSLWCAMETYPIIEHDVQNETDVAMIAGNYDPDNKTGFGFFINRVGKLSFRFFSAGWPVELVANQKLPLYKWNNLVAVADGSKLRIYNNGEEIASSNCKSLNASGTFLIGKSADGRSLDKFMLNTVNGLIDEIEIFDEAAEISTIQSWKTDETPELSIVAKEKYADDIMRPTFHGMPSRNWTNETHGLFKYNGKYHLFFQKNANGPFMSRLQWGHLVSDNLYEWEEMPIAIGSDHWYDLKGCWSGCVAIDDEITGGKPAIFYTGVDYARAMIGEATPADDDLLNWTKPADPVINGRPQGLSDDFRDCFFFRNGSDAYIIVGTSKDGKGACTLHKYNPSSRTWSNDGKIFFQASSVNAQGSFWEMPNMTKIGNRWLFTVTPLGLNNGVKAMYWTGTLNSDGTFNTSASPASIELPGFAKEGFGLLSPSIMQIDGKTIAMGIVPDKLPSRYNYDLGWAHTYSLPREWSLDASGQLIQRPYSGLEAMRGNVTANITKSINGSEDLGSMTDRTIEVVGEFEVADADFGFTFFKDGDCGVKLYYSPSSSRLVLDMRSIQRIANDGNLFNGLYTTSLPSSVAKGSVMKIHVFVDHSIMDIFINDKWASSVRLFPTDPNALGFDVFSEKGATTANVRAFQINLESAGIEDLTVDNPALAPFVDVYSLTGVMLRQKVEREEATAGLPAGIYIVGNRKVCIR